MKKIIFLQVVFSMFVSIYAPGIGQHEGIEARFVIYLYIKLVKNCEIIGGKNILIKKRNINNQKYKFNTEYKKKLVKLKQINHARQVTFSPFVSSQSLSILMMTVYKFLHLPQTIRENSSE